MVKLGHATRQITNSLFLSMIVYVVDVKVADDGMLSVTLNAVQGRGWTGIRAGQWPAPLCDGGTAGAGSKPKKLSFITREKGQPTLFTTLSMSVSYR